MLVYGSGPLAIAAIAAMRSRGLLAPTPVWVLVVIILGAGVANYTTSTWLARSPSSGFRLHARVAASVLSTAAVIYGAGWGAVLVIAYALGSSELLRSVGPRTLRANLVWNYVAILGGETAVALGLAPSVIDPTLGHAIAITGAICLTIVTVVLATTAQAVECAEEELRERSAYFEALVEHATDVIGDLTPDGTVRRVSPAVTDLLGYEPDDVEGQPVARFLAPEHAELLQGTLEQIVASPGRSMTFEIRLHHRDGAERDAVATLTSTSSHGRDGIIVNLHDVTLQRQLEAQLRHDARHDSLTGLLNRKAFARVSERVSAEACEQGAPVSVLFVDLDGFKNINDSFGHETGDRVLVETARRLQGCIRTGDVLARLGGDEFAILVRHGGDGQGPTDVADRILRSLTERIPGLPHDTRVGASIGIAVRTTDGIEISTLMRQADEAMYRAKSTGRARWEVATGSQP